MNINVDFAKARNVLVSIIKSVGTENIGTANGLAGEGCQYTNKPGTELGLVPLTPSCIVGYFFHYFGLLGLTVINDNGHEHGTCGLDSGLWSAADQAGFHVSEDAKRFLKHVQGKQDDGIPWGQALNDALHAMREEEITKVRDANPDLFWDGANRDVFDLIVPAEPLAPWERELLEGANA